MKNKSLLLITLGTIVLSRTVLYFLWGTPIMNAQRTDIWHHMYTGLILMILAKIIPKKLSATVFAIGLGLFLDELIHLFHMLGLTTAVDYWSLKSIAMTVIGLLIVTSVLLYYEKNRIKNWFTIK